MNRRQLLRSVAAGATAAIAGCNAPVAGPGPALRTEPVATGYEDGDITVRSVEPGRGRHRVEAAFDPAADVLTLVGTLPSDERCPGAYLDLVVYGPDDGLLTVNVATGARVGADRPADCPAPPTELIYEALFEFDGGLPSAVAVDHRGTDDWTGLGRITREDRTAEPVGQALRGTEPPTVRRRWG